MQRIAATRWFGLFLLASAVAIAAAVLGLAAFVPSTRFAPAPEQQPRIGTPEQTAQAAPHYVSIEPLRIEVIGKRSAVQVGARENPSSRRRPG